MSLLIGLLASPIAAATCASSCASHQQTTQADEDCCGRAAENHCPPESGAANQASHHHSGTANSNIAATSQNNCRCLKNAPQQIVLVKQKIQPTPHFYPVIQPQQLNLVSVRHTETIVFFTPNVVYPARSALSELPARAPPIL